jgi:Multiubiquitin
MPLSTADPASAVAQQSQEDEIKPVTVQVNERPVMMPRHRATGLEIKTAAIAQGVPIELDFILVEELAHGRTKVIGDDDPVHLDAHSRFLANDGDDNA